MINQLTEVETILFVDDEPNILDSFRRQLYKKYKIKTASNGKEALEFLSTSGPIPVIISDLRMPVMDGVQFFTKVKEIAPDSVRILLTGHADLTTAINAINEGKIFQFLTKPCPAQTLLEAIQAGMDHYSAATLDRTLLEQSHQMNLRLLTEMLSLANPAAYSRTMQIRKIVNRILSNLNTVNAWQYQLAATLCHIGCIAISSSLFEKAMAGDVLSERETRLITSHPMIGFRLLENVTRIESVALMIRDQDQDFSTYPQFSNEGETPEAHLGAQILKVAINYAKLVLNGMAHEEAINFLTALGLIYNPSIVKALGKEEILTNTWDVRLIYNEEIEIGMFINQDIYTKSGSLLFSKYSQVDSMILEKLQQVARSKGIVEPFRVLVPTITPEVSSE
jgi:response regulator RpfG family c-di-GMP phosphodiesterase